MRVFELLLLLLLLLKLGFRLHGAFFFRCPARHWHERFQLERTLGGCDVHFDLQFALRLPFEHAAGRRHIAVITSHGDANMAISGEDGVPNTDVKAKKASIGGGYTFAPGMSFRGSVTQLSVNAKDLGGTSENATQFALGTDIAF